MYKQEPITNEEGDSIKAGTTQIFPRKVLHVCGTGEHALLVALLS